VTRVLVIANETLRADRLHQHLRARSLSGPGIELRIVVPIRPPIAADLGGGLVGTVPLDSVDLVAIVGDAEDRLAATVRTLASYGAYVSGQVVSVDPLAAVDNELATAPVDEIIISTKPRAISRWLGLDLPRRIARRHPKVKVTVVENVSRSLASTA
jgi:hypothetical protein